MRDEKEERKKQARSNKQTSLLFLRTFRTYNYTCTCTCIDISTFQVCNYCSCLCRIFWSSTTVFPGVRSTVSVHEHLPQCVLYISPHSLTHSLSLSSSFLTHSLTLPLLLPPSLTHSLSLSSSLPHSLTHSPSPPPSLTHSLTLPLLLPPSLTHSLSLSSSFPHSLTHSPSPPPSSMQIWKRRKKKELTWWPS